MGWQGMALAKRDTEFLAEAARLASEPVTERAIEGILGVVQHGMGLVSASVRAEDSESWTSGLNDPNAQSRTLSLKHRGRPLGELRVLFPEGIDDETLENPAFDVVARLLSGLLRDRELDLAEREVEAYRDRMLRLVTHDLRAPLAQIIGYAHLLQMDVPDDPMLVRFIDGIIHATTSMDKLLESLLRLERIRHSPRELYERVPVLTLAQSVFEDTQDAAEQKNITIEANLEDRRDAYVMGDAFLLQRAMENLVNNALKFTMPEGRVTLHLSFSSGMAEYSVQDTGVGIPPDQLANVFVPFYGTGGRKGKSPSGGFGLGLSLVTSIIEEHEGKVFLTSTLGEGSVFGFRLPLVID
ncbi:MAG: HAMP domain-containing histidine kinase [Chloroflexi bacterium]|nr:HAMP domain-containing histidine kinase [Chloroflexota bacterium]